MQIDLNSDLGESFGSYTIGNDVEVMKYISSANVACGFHAGDPLVIERTIKLALEHGVAIGAHPSYPDLVGFGRRSMLISDDELRAMILYQVGALKSMVEALSGKLKHVKPHGALYNDLATDYRKSKIFCEAIRSIDPNLVVVGLANSQTIKAAHDIGLKAANEVFADRTYNNDGTLTSRSMPGAVIHDREKCLVQINSMIFKGTVTSLNDNEISIKADTICVHGDNSAALELVKAINQYLTQNGLEIKSLCNV